MGDREILEAYLNSASKNHQEQTFSLIEGLLRQAKVAHGVPGRLRPRIFLTFRHYKGGRSSAIRTGRLNPRRDPWYSLPEAESTSGHMVLSGVPRKKFSVTPLGIDPGTSRLVAQHLNHYATPGPIFTHGTKYLLNSAIHLCEGNAVVCDRRTSGILPSAFF